MDDDSLEDHFCVAEMQNRNLQRQNNALKKQLGYSDDKLTTAEEVLGGLRRYAHDNRKNLVEMRIKLQVQTLAGAYKKRENGNPRGELYWKDRRIGVLKTRLEVLTLGWKICVELLKNSGLIGRPKTVACYT